MSATRRNWRSAGCLGLPLPQVRLHGNSRHSMMIAVIAFIRQLDPGATLFLILPLLAPLPFSKIAYFSITNPALSQTKRVRLLYDQG